MSQPLDDLLTFAERAYIRMEAEQLITQCLDNGDTTPFNSLVEGLVLAGSSSLGVLREIQEELRSARSSLGKEGLGVRQDLVQALSEFGVNLPQLLSVETPEVFRQMCSTGLRREVQRAARDLANEDESLLQEICVEAGERVTRIARRLAVLSRLEDSVNDWLTGLAFEASQSLEFPMSPRRPSALH